MNDIKNYKTQLDILDKYVIQKFLKYKLSKEKNYRYVLTLLLLIAITFFCFLVYSYWHLDWLELFFTILGWFSILTLLLFVVIEYDLSVKLKNKISEKRDYPLYNSNLNTNDVIKLHSYLSSSKPFWWFSLDKELNIFCLLLQGKYSSNENSIEALNKIKSFVDELTSLIILNNDILNILNNIKNIISENNHHDLFFERLNKIRNESFDSNISLDKKKQDLIQLKLDLLQHENELINSNDSYFLIKERESNSIILN